MPPEDASQQRRFGLFSKGLFSMRHIAIQRLSVFVTAVAFLYVAGVVLGVL
jgi:hypothetical protein